MNTASYRVVPPGQCPETRKATLLDKFWAWYWGEPIGRLTQCRGYMGHADCGYPHDFWTPRGKT